MWYAAYTGQTGSQGALAQCWQSIGMKRGRRRLARLLATLPVALDADPGHLPALGGSPLSPTVGMLFSA